MRVRAEVGSERRAKGSFQDAIFVVFVFCVLCVCV